MEGDRRRANDAAKVQEGLFVHLVAAKEFIIIAKVPQEPTELPERSFTAVEPSGEGPCGERCGFLDDEAEEQEWLLRMPAVRSTVHADQEESIELTFMIVVI
jgi:hypothetical protein